MNIRADFHTQSRYTAGADKTMTLEKIVHFAKMKGIHVLGTGDALHPKWREELKRELKQEDDIYVYKGVYFVPSVEIKLRTFVHGVLLLPSLNYFDDAYKWLSIYGKLDKVGVPTVHIDGDEFLDSLEGYDYFFFPAHVFVPWQSIYGKYNSLKEFFKDRANRIKAVELGLSADPKLADKVPELRNRVFLTNSDFHTHWQIGREFNLIKNVRSISYKEIVRRILENNVVNYTLPPELGKYHLTACRKCGIFYNYEDAKMLNWKCYHCGEKIYLGVKDRIEMEIVYQKAQEATSKLKREFVYHIPLLHILTDILSYSKNKAENVYLELLRRTNLNECELLYEVDVDSIKIDEKVKDAIKRIRSGRYHIVPGGGGRTGRLSLEKVKIKFFKRPFKTLADFW